MSSAVSRVALPEVRQRGAVALHVAGLVLGGLGVVALLLGLVDAVGGFDLPGAVLLGVGFGLVVLGAAGALAARVWRGSRAERVAAQYRATVGDQLQDVVRRRLAAPTSAVLDRHRTLRHALAKGAPQDG